MFHELDFLPETVALMSLWGPLRERFAVFVKDKGTFLLDNLLQTN